MNQFNKTQRDILLKEFGFVYDDFSKTINCGETKKLLTDYRLDKYSFQYSLNYIYTYDETDFKFEFKYENDTNQKFNLDENFWRHI